MGMHLLPTTFNSRLISVLATNKASAIFFIEIYVFAQGKKLMCPIQLQSFLSYSEAPNVYYQVKMKSTGMKHLFQTILNKKYIILDC
jgi:hypothetical protein